MNLKDFLPIKDNKAKEHYWALVIEPGWIQAGIWEIGEAKAEVISVSSPTPWETDDDLIGACDTSLSAAIQNLPEEIAEPTKTVFGVPPSWVSEGQIKSEYLERIRKICADLSLTPSGFVVLPEAIANFIKSEEGTPLNGIVVGLGKENIEVAVFKLGNLSGITEVARSVSVSDDVLEGLARFGTADPLPSRFLLYDGKEGELEDVRQSLLGVSWAENDKVKFLHTPKIEIIVPDKKVMATALAGANELANILKVERISGPQATEIENVSEPKEEIVNQDLGFVVGEDVASTLPAQETPAPQTPIAMGPPPQEKVSFQNKIRNFIGGIRAKYFGPFSFGGPGIRTFVIGGAILLLALISLFVLWWYVPKAIVTIFVSPKRLEDKFSLTVDKNIKAPDIAKATVPGDVLTTEVSGEKTKGTSGTKTIGDKAVGTVKIENGNAAVINLPAGTILSSSSDLRFTTNTTASVSGATAPGFPGTANVDVTAANIGSEYNVAKDERFKVGNYPKEEVDAIAIANFSGGSSRQISAVSTDDQNSLEKDLTDELLAKARQDLSQGLAQNKFFIDESAVATPSARVFSNKVGDEASNLKLNLTLSVSALSIEKAQLFDLAKNTLKDKVPSGFVLRDEQLTFTFDLLKSKDGQYQFDVAVSVNLLPEIKTKEIAEKIAGKYPSHAESFLTTIAGFSRAEIKLIPALAGRLGTLPHVVKNITIEVSAER